MKKTKKKKEELRGLIHSGLLFIGDPSYMQGSAQESEAGIVPDALNPFKNWDEFTHSIGEGDVNMEAPGAFEPGRGVVVQTHILGGRYKVKKVTDKTTGKLKKVVVEIV